MRQLGMTHVSEDYTAFLVDLGFVVVVDLEF